MKIEDSQIQAAVAKAIVESLSGENKANLIQEAIKQTFFTQANPKDYYDKRTTIQVIFDDAVKRYAHQTVYSELETNEVFKEKFKNLMSEVIEKLFETSVRNELVKNIIETFNKGIERLRNGY